MNDTAKYLIRATIAADGVVERSDVVGAVFGQTEGLLGEELDLRDLQDSSRVGRIDVSIRSENGQSFGEVTVASSLDKVETAILAASLETIDRIGPCGAAVEVTSIEDVRAAKRREVVERAKELVASGFEETSLGSNDVLEEVREAARIEGIVDYEGLPAGPRVDDSDAIIVVEGRADVSTLLACGIKNAVAVEGTNVPDAVASLTKSRTTTAFLDGDRGGELILRELAQVGDVAYVAFAPPGESVEDLDRAAVFESLRGKAPYEAVSDAPDLQAAASTGPNSTPTAIEQDTNGAHASEDDPTAGSETGTGPESGEARTDTGSADGSVVESGGDGGANVGDGNVDAGAGVGDAEDVAPDDGNEDPVTAPDDSNKDDSETPHENEKDDTNTTADASLATDTPRPPEAHAKAIIDGETNRARLLDDEFEVLTEVDTEDTFEAVDAATTVPHAVIIDGPITQRILDVAAQRGVPQVFGRELRDVVKQPIGTHVVTVDDLAIEA